MTKGAEKATFCIKKPATDEPTAQKILRPRFAMPLANVRSLGRTTAATYDWRGGTSISRSASRHRHSTIATFNEGANPAATRNQLEVKRLKTIDIPSPTRLANQA